MLVYTIRKSKYADRLVASGVPNRWNKKEEYVIYAGSSVSLATLEMVAHRDTINIGLDYKLMIIDVTVREADIFEMKVDKLPENWKFLACYPALQNLGSAWYKKQQSVLLKVPSVLVPRESNYLINTKHPDFTSKVTLHSVEDFVWDRRLII